MITFLKFCWIAVSLFGLFLLFKTAIPTIPVLEEKIRLDCIKAIFDGTHLQYLGNGIFYCKTSINLDTLYKAKAITARIRISQKAKMRIASVSIKKDLFQSTTLEVAPNESNEALLTFRFDGFENPKINHLISDIDGIYMFFSDFEEDKDLNLKLEELYLE